MYSFNLKYVIPTKLEETQPEHLRTCSKCKRSKKLDKYPAHILAINGRMSVCKSCHNKRANEIRAERERKRDEYRIF